MSKVFVSIELFTAPPLLVVIPSKVLYGSFGLCQEEKGLPQRFLYFAGTGSPDSTTSSNSIKYGFSLGLRLLSLLVARLKSLAAKFSFIILVYGRNRFCQEEKAVKEKKCL